MSKLKQSVEQMEAARKDVDPLQQLRHWRLQATLRHVGKALVKSKAASKPPVSRRGAR